MAYRRSGSSSKRKGRRARPGFEKPRKGGGFPWWILAIVVVVPLLGFGVFKLAQGPAVQVTETPAPSSAPVETPTLAPPTDTPSPPTPSPTPETRACEVLSDTRIYREPSAADDVISQEISVGGTVHMVKPVTSDDAAWYEVLLPGDDVAWYVAVDTVGCK